MSFKEHLPNTKNEILNIWINESKKDSLEFVFTDKAVLQGKVICKCTYKRKFSNQYLSFHLKKPDKEEKIIPKASKGNDKEYNKN